MSNPLRLSRQWRAFVFGALVLLAANGVQAAQRPLDAAVEVDLAPAASDGLVAGGRALLEWKSADLPHGVEEWEAFLSYDGGATWPVRLTPHLGVDRRRVEVELPPIASDDARLLLRFGDERDERELEVERPFAIAAARLDLDAAVPALAPTSGETARPGLAGVVWWVEGDRRGRGLVRREAGPRGLATGVPALHDGASEAAAGDNERAPRLPLQPESRALAGHFDASAQFASPILVVESTGRRLAILSRRNE